MKDDDFSGRCQSLKERERTTKTERDMTVYFLCVFFFFFYPEEDAVLLGDCRSGRRDR